VYRDEVLEELWRIRDQYVAEHHHDLDEIVEDLRRRQTEHPDRLVDRRRTQPGNNTPPEPHP
jgi:hypothetical protein